MSTFHRFLSLFAPVALLCLSAGCKENFSGPVDNDISDKIIADYVRKVTEGKPYTLYVYSSPSYARIRLSDSINGMERICESDPAYVYFLDEEPDLEWPHACQSVWIDRRQGTLTMYQGENPLRGSEKWLVVNNLYDEGPRMGLSAPVLVNHPDGVVQPCLHYRFEGDMLYMEHQWMPVSPASTTLSVTDSQSVRLLHIVAEDPDTNCAEPLLLKHYGFQIHLDSLYVPIDSVTTQRLGSIPLYYQMKRGDSIINTCHFEMPTSGSGKIDL